MSGLNLTAALGIIFFSSSTPASPPFWKDIIVGFIFSPLRGRVILRLLFVPFESFFDEVPDGLRPSRDAVAIAKVFNSV